MVDVLLAVRNGAVYLEDFVVSLSRQTFRDFQVLVFDDASKDNSVEILHHLCREYGIRMIIVDSVETSLGIVNAYNRLVQSSHSPYLCYADQDDVWHHEKIEKCMLLMRKNENRHNLETPILIHSDLRVCDHVLSPIHESFVRYQRLSPENTALNKLLIQNSTTGCTMLFNRSLANLIQEFPRETIYHDWFTAITASAFGVIDYIPQALVNYRQHGKNHLGAVRYGWSYIWGSIKSGRNNLHIRLIKTQEQSKGFLTKNHGVLTPQQYKIVEKWATINQKTILQKRIIVLLNSYTKNTLVRTLGMLWAL